MLANKGMKQTSVERIGRSQLIPSVGQTDRWIAERKRRLGVAPCPTKPHRVSSCRLKSQCCLSNASCATTPSLPLLLSDSGLAALHRVPVKVRVGSFSATRAVGRLALQRGAGSFPVCSRSKHGAGVRGRCRCSLALQRGASTLQSPHHRRSRSARAHAARRPAHSSGAQFALPFVAPCTNRRGLANSRQWRRERRCCPTRS
jgi:hypothetical protein